MKKIKQIINRFLKFFIVSADVNNDGKLSKDDIKTLQKKTKKQLESLGRKIGVELDRRLTKSKLITKIKQQNKKL